jgi:hypothetical protein
MSNPASFQPLPPRQQRRGNSFWLTVPPSDIARRFDELTAPLMAKIKANADQSRTLAILRDMLLPKLLSITDTNL